MALLPSVPHWFIARKNLPPANMQELIAYMKANDGKVTAASVGAGGSSAVCAYYLGKAHRHHDDAGAVSRRRACLAGHRRRQRRHDVRSRGEFAVAGEGRQHQGLCGDGEEALVCRARRSDRRRGGRCRASRSPTGSPPTRPRTRRRTSSHKLNAAFKTAMADPAVPQRIADMGLEIPPPEQQTPAAFAALSESRDGQMGRGHPRVRHQGAVTIEPNGDEA